MNLLTGLALDDIQKIEENAEFKKLSMQVELVLGLERLYQSLLFWIPKSSYKQNSKTHITSVEASSVAFLKRSYYLSWEYIIPSIIDGADDSSDTNSIDQLMNKQRELKSTILDLSGKLDSLQEDFTEFSRMFNKRRNQINKVKIN